MVDANSLIGWYVESFHTRFFAAPHARNHREVVAMQEEIGFQIVTVPSSFPVLGLDHFEGR